MSAQPPGGKLTKTSGCGHSGRTCRCIFDRAKERLYVLYADGEISLEVVEVLGQLVAVVIVGEESLEEC